MYNRHGIGLIRGCSDDQSQLRLQCGITTCQFDNFVDERYWHIVDDEPPQIFQVIGGLRTSRPGKTCNEQNVCHELQAT
jgi:hypothetical protein